MVLKVYKESRVLKVYKESRALKVWLAWMDATWDRKGLASRRVVPSPSQYWPVNVYAVLYVWSCDVNTWANTPAPDSSAEHATSL